MTIIVAPRIVVALAAAAAVAASEGTRSAERAAIILDVLRWGGAMGPPRPFTVVGAR